MHSLFFLQKGQDGYGIPFPRTSDVAVTWRQREQDFISLRLSSSLIDSFLVSEREGDMVKNKSISWPKVMDR